MDNGLKKITIMNRIRWGMNSLAVLFFILSAILFCKVFLFHTPYPLMGLFALLFSSLIFFFTLKPYWNISLMNITRFLDQKYAVLEESTSLFLKPKKDLSGLEAIQIKKIESRLIALPHFFIPWLIPLISSLILFVLVSILGFWAPRFYRTIPNTQKSINRSPSKYPSSLETFSEIKILVYPPAYLKKKAYPLPAGNIKIEQGSVVKWQINLAGSRSIQIRINGKDSFALSPGQLGALSFKKPFDKACFYQIVWNGRLSELFTIEIIPDQIPVVRIVKPNNNRKIEAGEKPILDLGVIATDDYGIKQFLFKATLAKGSGEAVKFKEYTEVLHSDELNKGDHQEYSLQKRWPLSHFDMNPGDALYFYITATDSHNQIGKSDVYSLSIQDTAGILSMEGMVMGVNIKPEFFRSERQIIIDSEHLIYLGNSISKEKFNDESNNLGIDQKILRLRYGKFLGEESESEVGGDAQKSDGLSSPADFGNASKVLDAYTDKHDQAEDASFFDASQKAQLKDILNEMWKAELNLRMHKPESALPFEYKALVLLKDLQQKSRAFVSKAPLHENRFDFTKRLSGDLSQISNANNQYPKLNPDMKQEKLYQAIEYLESLKNGNRSETGFADMVWTEDWLKNQAAINPEKYVGAFILIQRIIQRKENSSKKDLDDLENLLVQNLKKERRPQAINRFPDKGLGNHYFKELYHKTP